MGCDIHVMLEKKYYDKWVSVNQCPVNTGRSYDFFAAIANVRCRGEGDYMPVGIPKDACSRTHYEVERCGIDGHSHSWMEAEKFTMMYTIHSLEPEVAAELVSKRLEGNSEALVFNKLLDYFGYTSWDDEIYIEEFRFVFWFDN